MCLFVVTLWCVDLRLTVSSAGRSPRIAWSGWTRARETFPERRVITGLEAVRDCEEIVLKVSARTFWLKCH